MSRPAATPSRPSPAPAPAPVKVAVRGVGRVFERKRDRLEALRDVSLDVHAGELVCVLGPSGCGKTTLLNLVAGFDAPTTGDVTIDGERVAGPDPRRVLVFQEYGVFPWATVAENVALGLRALPRDEQARRVRHYVELVGLSGFGDTYPSELSGGMKQRVAVARALAVQPDVMLMDEPLGALDSLTRLQLRAEILRIWQQERMTVMLVTHDVDESIQLADRIVVLTPRPGRIAEIVPVEVAHPRDIGSPEYGRIKNRLYALLGVSHAI